MEDLSGEQRLILAVTEVRGPAHAVIAVLEQGKRDGLTFATAYFNAIRALQPPRSAPGDLQEQIADDRKALAEIRPFLKSAYEGQEPSRADLTRARRLAEKRLDTLLAA